MHIWSYSSSELVYVTKLLSHYADFDEIFCVCSGEFKNGLDENFDPVGGITTEFKALYIILICSE